MSLLACENAEGISRGNRGDILNILGRKKLNDFKCKYLPLACENAEGISRGNRGDILNILERETIVQF